MRVRERAKHKIENEREQKFKVKSIVREIVKI